MEFSGLELMPKRISDNNNTSTAPEIDSANLAVLFESIDNPVWSIDKDGLLVACNNVFTEFFRSRFKKEAKIGMQVFEEIPPIDIAEWKLLFDRAIEGEKVTAESKLCINKATYYFDIIVTPIINVRKKIVGQLFLATI